MWTAKPGAPTRPSWELAARATHTSTSGGSSETDENEAAVIPTGSSPSRAVTTVTPLGQRASVSRNRRSGDALQLELPLLRHRRSRELDAAQGTGALFGRAGLTSSSLELLASGGGAEPRIGGDMATTTITEGFAAASPRP